MSRFNLFGVVSLSALCAFAAAACSDDDESPLEAFASEYCNLIMPCCGASGFTTDPSTCTQMLTFLGMGSEFNESRGNACLSAMRAEKSSEDYCAKVTAVEACQNVLAPASGSVQPGGACEFDSDCAASAEGRGACVSASDEPGAGDVCMILGSAGAGASPCVGNDLGSMAVYSTPSPPPQVAYLCKESEGAYCDYDTSTCVAMKQVGETCDYDTRCVGDAYCDSTTSACRARVPIGSPCSGYQLDECVATAYCSDQGTCAKQLPAGSACTKTDQCEGNCVDGKCEPPFDLGFAFLCGGS